MIINLISLKELKYILYVHEFIQQSSARSIPLKSLLATDYRVIVGTAVSTRFRFLSRSRRSDDQRSGIFGRPTGSRERAKSRRKEKRKIIENFWTVRPGNGTTVRRPPRTSWLGDLR